MQTITVALWAANLEIAAANLTSWIAAIDTRMAEAKAAGAELLVMPEFACSQWLAFAPPELPVDGQIPWLAALTPLAIEGLRPLPSRHGVALLAGTMPFTDKNNWTSKTTHHFNRAFLLRLLSRNAAWRGGGRSWPGAWSADRVTLVDPAGDRIQPIDSFGQFGADR
jgi:hypothetical protein